MDLITLVIIGILIIFVGGVAFLGAPYVPTLSSEIKVVMEVAGLKKGDLLIDLGSGDGRLLSAAAKRGIDSIGYEIHPLLVLISRIRLRRYKKYATVIAKNYWNVALPDNTTVIFTFLAKPYMKRLKHYVEDHVSRTGKPVVLLSYAFELPGYKPTSKRRAVIRYDIKPK